MNNDPVSILLRSSVHQFIGNLGKDPEVRYLESGKCVANVNIGISLLADKNQTDWIKLEIWGEEAQRFADTCRKGNRVQVAGRIKTDRWTDRNTGEAKSQLCCMVEIWKVLASPGGQTPAAATAAPQAPAPAPAAVPTAAAMPPHLAAVGWAPNPANGTVAWNSAPLEQPSDGGIPF